MTVTSRIASYAGVPTLFVNDKPQVGMAYITYLQERNRYKDFAKAGYTLFTFATFFGDQTINETTHPAPFSPALFGTKGQADFSSFDDTVQEIIEACPTAMIFPRVNMSLPRWWELENPNECNDTGSKQYPEVRRACFSSRKWRDQSEDFLRQLIRHVEQAPWKDHIVGYQIASGNTEEWFPFDQVGSIGKASREAFLRADGNLDDTVAYRRFLSFQIADAINHLAGVVKDETARRLAVGAFYGYTLETPFWTSGHMALNHVLNCGDVDFLCSPSSYMNTRSPGQDWPCITVLDSLKLHGKAYFVELDTRTHLTKALKDSRENSTVPGTYLQDIWFGPKSPDVSRWLLRANIGRQLTHGYNSWWFDMWGGWYDSPEMMQEMEDLRKLGEQSLAFKHRESMAQVAVFVDEQNYALLNLGKQNGILGSRISYYNRNPLGLAGAPYDIYEINDFEAVFTRYKAIVMLVPAMTPAMENAIARCKQFNIDVLVADENSPDLTTGKLRRFYADANVHCWIDTDDVVYASRDLLVIHTATPGKKLIRLPETRSVTPLLPAGPTTSTNSVVLDLKQFETRIFRLN